MTATLMQSLGTLLGPVLDNHGNRLTAVENTKASKATVDALAVETGQTTTRLTALESGKADKTAVDALITTSGQTTTRLTALESGKADKTTVDALTTTSGQTTTRLTALESGKADKTALDTLAAQVSTQLGGLNIGTTAEARSVLVAAGLLSA